MKKIDELKAQLKVLSKNKNFGNEGSRCQIKAERLSEEIMRLEEIASRPHATGFAARFCGKTTKI